MWRILRENSQAILIDQCSLECVYGAPGDIIDPIGHSRGQGSQHLRQMLADATEDGDGAFRCLSAGDLNAVGVWLRRVPSR